MATKDKADDTMHRDIGHNKRNEKRVGTPLGYSLNDIIVGKYTVHAAKYGTVNTCTRIKRNKDGVPLGINNGYADKTCATSSPSATTIPIHSKNRYIG